MKRSDWLNNSFPETQAKRSNAGESKSQNELKGDLWDQHSHQLPSGHLERLSQLTVPEARQMEREADERGLLGWQAEVVARLQQAQGPFDREVSPTMRERQNRGIEF